MMQRRVPDIIYVCIGLLFAFAAGAKIAAPEAVRGTLIWFGMSPGIAALGVDLLIVVEFALAIGLLHAPQSRMTRWGGVCMLVVFTAFLGVIYFSTSAPSCGCVGLVQLFQSRRTEAMMGISRNLLLLAMMVWDIPELRQRKRLESLQVAGEPHSGQTSP